MFAAMSLLCGHKIGNNPENPIFWESESEAAVDTLAIGVAN